MDQRLRVASIVGKDEEQKLGQHPFLLPPMGQAGISPLGTSPSTLSQHVHAYSHVGKSKTGSNSSSSVGSQNGSSSNSVTHTASAPHHHGPLLSNGANFSGAIQQFAASPNILAAPLNSLVSSVHGSQSLNSPAMHSAAMAAMAQHVPLVAFGNMLPLLGNQPVSNGTPAQVGARHPGQTSNSASSSSFSYPSGGNSGGSNSSDTRTQLSSGDSEEDGGAVNAEGMVCRRTARREYHKKIERKRRDRMRMLYDKLRSLTEASELADKNGVLEGAIALIQELKQQNQELLARAAMLESAQCSSSSTGDTASTGDSREGSVASGSSEAERENKRCKTAR